MQNLKKLVVFFFIISLGFEWMPIPSGWAAYDYRFDAKDDLHGQYESSASAKLTRGLTNVLFGWTELVRTPTAMAAGIEHNKITAFLLGVPYGIVKFGARTVVGVYEVVTFYAPQSPIMPEIRGDVE